MATKKGSKHWDPTDKELELLKEYAKCGVSQNQIAAAHGISVDTLSRRCGDILSAARADGVKQIGGALFRNAIKGNVTAQIFYLKTQGGWRETEHVVVKHELPRVVLEGQGKLETPVK